MPNYNYHVLSPTEFENLARDLVQRKESIVLETFKEGKDSGIDLRFAEDKSKTIIVQAKRFKNDYEYLYGKLKDEVPKVKKLKPTRYILVTSVGLTPLNKTAIVTLFEGYIKTTGDIIAKDDIDNLIGMYPDLEKAHYKLWLTSTNILQEILNSKEYNQSRFELESIVEEIKFYVPNGSFEKALEIIKREKFVVISGLPGIGKTTLARMLAYQFLANGYEDFIHISEDIDAAYALYIPGKKQVFLYDDFLGKNFLSEKLSKNEDRRIITFIEKIKREQDKVLIMVTREYILRQAELEYPDLTSLRASMATVELSDYTELIKAQILFNHLFFNDISSEYLDNILLEQNYLKIIAHENYSPRIVAAIAKDKLWEKVRPEDFTKTMVEYLENPFKIWENVFETKISELSRQILLVLTISATPMLLDDLRMAVEKYTSFSAVEFKASLKELEQTFILTMADTDGIIAVEFQNNSILDYLLNYLKNNRHELNRLLRGISFISQGFDMFEFPKKDGDFGLTLIQNFTPIMHDEYSLAAFKETLEDRINTLKPSCKAFRKNLNGDSFLWVKHYNGRMHWLAESIKLFNLEKDEIIRTKLVALLSQINPMAAELDDEFSPLLYLLYHLGDHLSTNVPALIEAMAEKVSNFGHLERFCELSNPYKPEFIAFRDTDQGKILIDKAEGFCAKEFTKGMAVTLNPPATDFFTRTIYKAEMERICEEINYVSERLGLGIFLDSDYHKEYVRSKLKEHAIEDNLNAGTNKSELYKAIAEIFAGLKH